MEYNKILPVEIQLSVAAEIRERLVYYDAKLVTEQVGSGDDYDVIHKVISIVILDENLILNSSKYHHRFTLYDPDAGVELSDLIEINTLELQKLPSDADGTPLYDWARFIAAETEEELEKLADRNPEVKRAVVKFRELSADERVRDTYFRREMMRRDIASQNKKARLEGRLEGRLDVAQNALRMNMPISDIIKLTGLTKEEIDNL